MDRQGGVSHIGYMSEKASAPNRIAELRKGKKLSQQQLADKIGSHWITVSRLERGIIRLSDDWRERIADALGVDQWDLVIGAKRLPWVHVEGFIEEGGKVIPYDEHDVGESFSLSTNFFTSPTYRWLLVAGDALWPFYQDGDRVCLRHVEEDEAESHRGRVCVGWFKAADSDDEDVAVGVLERGRQPGTYTINRVGMPPLRELKLTSLAVVAMAVYYLGPDSIEENIADHA